MAGLHPGRLSSGLRSHTRACKQQVHLERQGRAQATRQGEQDKHCGTGLSVTSLATLHNAGDVPRMCAMPTDSAPVQASPIKPLLLAVF